MILETINSPADVKCLSEEQTATLCRELRSFLVEQVSRTGGHLASNLGVVELTVAIHRVFDTATDRLVLDVGAPMLRAQGTDRPTGVVRYAAAVRWTVRLSQAL